MSRSRKSQSSIATALIGVLALAAVIVARLLGVSLPGENTPPIAGNTPVSNTGSSVSGLPAQSFKQTAKEITFHSCPPEGDGSDPVLNRNKNRVDDGNFQPTAFNAIVNLKWPSETERT